MTTRRPTNLKQIFDIDGNLMYEGRARSVKALVEQCVKNGKSLKRANLAGHDLMHLELSRGDFTGACLDGARLRGSRMVGAHFTGASMKGVSASAVDAESAVFQDVDLSPYEYETRYDDGRVEPDGTPSLRKVRVTSDFIGSVLTYCRFDGARVLETDFSDAGMSSTSHTGATVRKSSFRRARLHNADWADARIIGSSFDGALMTPRMNVDPAHLPDRTRNAVIVGNSYEGAEFGSGNRGFVKDAFVVGKVRLATLGLVTSGLFVATAAIPFDLESALSETIGKTATFILAASALTWIKEPVEDFLKDNATEFMAGTAVRVRAAISELWKRGKQIGSLAVALLSRGHADHVEKVLKSRHGGVFERFAAAAKGEYDVVVCDRKHLAEALARVSEMMNNRTGQRHSVILVRMGQTGGDTPRAIVVNGDGGLEALWDQDEGGNIRHMRWDAAKIPLDALASVRFQAPFNSHIPIVTRFISAIMEEHGLADFRIRHETHLVRQGRDGSIVVTRQSDGRLDNRGAPTVVTPDDRRLFFKNSVAYDEDGMRIRQTRNDPPAVPFAPR